MTWSRSIGAVVLVSAALLAGVTAGTAPAATRIGPDLAPVPCAGQTFCFAGVGCSTASCWYLNVPAVGGTPAISLKTPFAGVITKWRFRGGCCTDNVHDAQKLTLRAFEPGFYDNNPYRTAQPTASGATFEIPANGQASSTNEAPIELPARMPVAADKYLGIEADKLVGFSVYSGTSAVQAGIGGGSGDSERSLYTFNDTALAINFDLEHDADGDGYGDETQDCTPQDPATHVACDRPFLPTTTSPLPVFRPSPPGTPPPNAVAVPILISGTGAPTVRADGAVFIAVKCPPAAASACGGFLLIEGPSGGAKKSAAKLKLAGRSRYSVKPGATKKVKVKLNRAARKLLARNRKLKVRVTIKPDGGGVVTKYVRTLKAAKPKAKH